MSGIDAGGFRNAGLKVTVPGGNANPKCSRGNSELSLACNKGQIFQQLDSNVLMSHYHYVKCIPSRLYLFELDPLVIFTKRLLVIVLPSLRSAESWPQRRLVIEDRP